MNPIQSFDLGRWFPELGDYKKWEAQQIQRFKENHVLTKEDACDTHTGGVLLVVEGYLCADTNFKGGFNE